MSALAEYFATHSSRHVSELLDWLSIPSVSAKPDHKGEVARAADWLAQRLRDAGAKEVELVPTAGHPIVYAEHIVDKELPTVLIYGHYDVQPPEPLNLWTSPPFEPVIRKTDKHPESGAIFARGSADDKGQVYMHVAAFEAMAASGEFPCNLKFVIEGEEEVGSVNLASFLDQYRDRLACDMVLVSDTSLLSRDVPSLTVGLRGLSYVEVKVTGPNRDLHSGVYGGSVTNPINALAKMIASLHDEQGRITVPGFYDEVVELSRAERDKLAEAPFDEAEQCRELKVDALGGGEQGYTPPERASIRPTLDANGIWGGYTGDGAKTVLPSEAFAKISMRLVPNQSPDRITELFTKHFESLAPAGVRVEVSPHHGGQPATLSIESVEFAAASAAMERVFGRKPIPTRGGGSIPIVSLFEDRLQVSCVLMGFGLDSDDIHSPDEHFGVENFHLGKRTIPVFLEEYAKRKRAQ